MTKEIEKETTGFFFKNKLNIDEIWDRLRLKMPQINWKLGNKYYEGGYYIFGFRSDGVKIKINKEDNENEYYLGVYFCYMPVFPDNQKRQALAKQIHKEILSAIKLSY